jgi:hypothetical protein
MPNAPVSPDDPRGPSQLRASDADREQTAETLRQAAGDGRLTLGELDQRLEAAYAAKTYAELEKLTEDLPAAGAPVLAGSLPARRFGGTPTSRFGLALLSGFERAGRWVAPRHFTAVAVMGGGSIDMRDASFAEQTVRITAVAVMGGIDIVVPEDAEVRVHGLPLLGGFGGHRLSGTGKPGGPTVIVAGVAIMGGVDVRRRPPSKDGGDHAADDDTRSIPYDPWQRRLDRERYRAQRRAERHLRHHHGRGDRKLAP